ncbi:MAG: ParA family protein [Woeseia sp.]
MFISPNRDDLHKIVILNPKGGCGKTTLATNLASYYALRGPPPTLIDNDPNGYTMRWLEKRPRNRCEIHGIATYKSSMHVTRSWQLRIPNDTTTVIIDTPAALTPPDIHELAYDANSILIPVLPSAIDIRYATKFIADLLLVTQIDRRDRQLAVIANRTRQNTHSLTKLMRFLTSLEIPIIAVLRDSQNYVRAADLGMGIYEMPQHRVKRDTEQMDLIINWLDGLATRKQEHQVFSPLQARPEPPAKPLH